ncbi:MAG: hypothetical protein K0R63_1742 [Rickettsiales bacterium]|jgi:heme exporter protein D|nr:hypothetical protein [Rickettsiales bacterium]
MQGDYTSYIIAAYGITGIMLIGMLGITSIRAWKQKQVLSKGNKKI